MASAATAITTAKRPQTPSSTLAHVTLGLAVRPPWTAHRSTANTVSAANQGPPEFPFWGHQRGWARVARTQEQGEQVCGL